MTVSSEIFSKIKKVYFIGIKGAGMSALAQIFKGLGLEVLGSDVKDVFFSDAILKKAGIRVLEGFRAENIPKDADLIVASESYLIHSKKGALTAGGMNPEIQEVLRRGLPLISYSLAVSIVFNKSFGIAVCGTHGKSTTTSMLGEILESAGLDPTVLVGTEDLKWHSNARIGGKFFILEADEYRGAFLKYKPRIVVLTNVDYDHPDYFKTRAAYLRAFRQFISCLAPDDYVVAPRSRRVQRVLAGARAQVVFYPSVNVSYSLSVPGSFNQLNAQAAAAAARILSIPEEVIRKSLSEFSGTRRRFEFKGIFQKNGCRIRIFDDYAHHPEEIKATLKAFKAEFPRKKIYLVFQPHTFSRTKALFNDFVRSFELADELIIPEIYASAREKKATIKSQDLVKAVIQRWHSRGLKGRRALFKSFNQISAYLKKHLECGSILITMGAGDVWKVAEELIKNNK